ncbi:MAG TPA: amino acid permease [Acholeplasmataceae bacterium]|nr:amino acid permease [Acholeplasmataceae bacterium]
MTQQKTINVWSGISILAGIMIGSGIFFLGFQILDRSYQSLPLSILAWVVGGLITLFSGLSYAELGTLFTENGGYYVYLKEAYGKRMAFLSGFMNLILSSSGSIALLAILFGQIIANIFPGLSSVISLIAFLAILVLSLINFLGLKIGTLVQMIFMAAKLIPIVMIIIMGLLVGEQELVSTSLLDGKSFFQILVAFGFAVVGTLWAYEGWTNLNVLTGHMKNVKKDLPKALSIATIGVMAIYVLFIVSLYRVVAYTDLLSATYGWFIFNAAYTLFGSAGQLIIMISVAISVFGALNGSILVFPRVYQKMAEDGLFFKSVAKNHPKYQTPHISLILSAVFASILVAAEFLISSISVESLLTFVVFAGLIFNTLIFISLFKFRKTHPVEQYPRYQVWGYPVVPGLAILGLVMLLVATLLESLVPSLIGLGVLILGYMIFTWIELRKKKLA